MRFLSLLFSVIFFLQIAVAGDREVVTDTLTLKPSLTTKPGRDGQLKVDSADNKLKKFSSAASSWQEITGSGGGAVNFLSGGDAEGQAISAAYVDTTTSAQPVDGVGGTGLITFAQSSTTPLSGTKSFIFSKTGSVDLRGHGRSIDFTIDNASKAKVLQVSFDYQVASGTFTAGTRTTDSDMVVYIYDVTNAQVIQPSTYKLFSNSTTTPDKFIANFQTASNSTSYRLIFHQALSGTNNYDLRIDNIAVSPSSYVFGTPVTDWAVYTPTYTNLGTVSYTSVRYRRVGDSLQILGGFTTGTTIAGTAKISLPPGLSVDTGKMSNTSMIVGDLVRFTANASTRKRAKLIISQTDTTNLFFTNDDYTTASSPSGGLDGNALFGPGEGVSIQALNIPILGWSSSTQMSDSADTRVVAATGSGTTTAISAGTYTAMIPTASTDTHGGAYNTSTGLYTAPVAGFYQVDMHIEVNGTFSAGGAVGVGYKIGAGGTLKNLGLTRVSVSGSIGSYYGNGSRKVFLNAGDVFYPLGYSSIAATPADFYFSINRVSGPTSISATESVAFSARNSSGQSIPNNAATTVTNWTLIDQTHGAFNPTTGIFTAPAGGRYHCSASINFGTAAPVANSVYEVTLSINGSSLVAALNAPTGTAASYINSNIAFPLSLKAGDAVSVLAYQNTGGSRSLLTDPRYTFFSCVRTGL